MDSELELDTPPQTPNEKATAGPSVDAAAGVVLTLEKLSLSIIPPPSSFTKLSQKLKLTANKASGNSNISEDKFKDITNVGINIFRNVDLTVKPGQVCIILGGSGSGKTTLLNTIAGRMTGNEVLTSGVIQCNGERAKNYWNSGSVGYLQQQDFLMPYLTVRETLKYAANLRLPKSMTSKAKKDLVNLVLLELGLKDCADTIVGDAGGGESGTGGIRGISGGERRRVSAGVQLLTNPKMLLCDEVTSGLDAFSAFEVMKTFTNLAKSSQKTIVISIHQPRSEIFKLLADSDGQMVLLSRGDVVYSGPVRAVLPWVESIGMGLCPSGVNPFDFLLDMSMIDFASEETEKLTAVKRNLLVKAWTERSSLSASISSPLTLYGSVSAGGESSELQSSKPNSVSMAVDMVPKGSGPSLLTQIRVLTSRGWVNQRRDSMTLYGCLGESVVIGILVGAIFFQIDDSLAGIRSRASLCYSVGAIQSYLMLMITIYRLASEMSVYDRERSDRWYGPLPHIVSTVLYSALPNAAYPILFSSITYYMVGFRTDDVSHFGWWVIVNLLMQYITFVFAMTSTAIVRGFSSASLLANAIFAFMGLATGFFVVPSDIPIWLRWIKYIAYPNVAYEILTSNEFTDRRFDCPYLGVDGSWDPVKCAAWDGNTILQYQLDLKVGYFPLPITHFLYYIAAFLFLTWLALTLNVVNPTAMGAGPTLMDVFIAQVMYLFKKPAASAPQSPTVDADASSATSIATIDLDLDTKKETRIDVFARGLEKKEPVTIRVEGLGLTVSLSKFEWSFKGIMSALRREKFEKQLLKEVDAVFPAGELTAILGGSGAGKTSLLNILLHRSPANLKMRGAVYYNGSKNPSLRQVTSVASYVRQDDAYLLSHLTVRETLRYAAELNMDGSMTLSEKHAKVEEIIDLLGLRECADVIVGSSAVKGCSGGQRRRVSIGLQLVTEPTCLFLDEPTSGLDALTSKSIVLTLKQIAATGRTVVCTIHQPRADIWHVFDNVVLLVTGGCAAYSGRADGVVQYFEDAGYVVPALTNTPDFILDTASVNLRSPELEKTTRQTVDGLVARFNERKADMLAAQLPKFPLTPIGKKNPQYAEFSKAFPILTRRSFVNTFRQRGLYFNRLAQPISVAVIMCIFFARLGHGPNSVTARFGLLQQTAPLIFAGMLNNVALYPAERDIAYREISDGGYGPTSFFMMFLVNELPLEIISSLSVTLFMLVITGMKTTVVTFMTFWLVIFGYISAGESLGLAFSTLVTHAGFNVTVMSAVISVFSFMTGFFSLSIPKFLDVINHVSILKYGSVLLAVNELRGQLFDCTPEQVQVGSCPIQDGDQALALLQMDHLNWDLFLGLLVVCVVVYRFMAWVVLMIKVKSFQTSGPSVAAA